VQVPLTEFTVWFGDAAPGVSAENRLPVVRRKLTVLAETIAEHVDLALR
jgi:hypothetical protein